MKQWHEGVSHIKSLGKSILGTIARRKACWKAFAVFRELKENQCWAGVRPCWSHRSRWSLDFILNATKRHWKVLNRGFKHKVTRADLFFVKITLAAKERTDGRETEEWGRWVKRLLHYSRQEVTTLTKVVSVSWREVKRLRKTEKEIKNNDLVSGLNNWRIRVPMTEI